MSIWFIIGTSCISNFPTTNFTPEIESISPSKDSIFNAEETILFSIQIFDPDTESRDLYVQVESNLDGMIFDGIPDGTQVLNQGYNQLSNGYHLLEFTVSDNENNYTSDSTSITVNALPEITQILLSPSEPNTENDLEVLILQSNDDDGDVIVPTY